MVGLVAALEFGIVDEEAIKVCGFGKTGAK